MKLSQVLPFLTIPAMLVAVEIIALLLSLPLQTAGITAFENPESVANPLIFIAILLVFTAFLLLLIRFKWKRIITIIIAVSIFFTFIYIYAGITIYFLENVTGGLGITGITLLLSLLSTAVLFLHPEWYVIDTLGILIAAGAASIFGISLTILPVIILLIILMIYDAISVYKTRHMITLAEGVVDIKSPILFIVPKKRGYSYIREGVGNIDGGERSALIIGMGDLIMPSILVVSANTFPLPYGWLPQGWLPQVTRIGFITIPSLGAIIGSIVGLVLLLTVVRKGKPQAGLPPINGGAIAGFLVGYGLTLLI